MGKARIKQKEAHRALLFKGGSRNFVLAVHNLGQIVIESGKLGCNHCRIGVLFGIAVEFLRFALENLAKAALEALDMVVHGIRSF